MMCWQQHAVSWCLYFEPVLRALSWQVWVRPSAEMQFLYGNHVLKSGLGRITEGTPAYTGVVGFWLTSSLILD